MRASKPFSLSYGRVESVAPLRVTLDQKLMLEGNMLLPVLSMRERTFSVLADGVEKTVTVTVPAQLSVGDRVILLRADGGQKYILLDKWEGEG